MITNSHWRYIPQAEPGRTRVAANIAADMRWPLTGMAVMGKGNRRRSALVPPGKPL